MKDFEWISAFTGLPVADPKAPPPTAPSSGAPVDPSEEKSPPVDPVAAIEAFEENARRKAMLLAAVRKDIAVIKGRFQNAMSQEVKLKDTYIANWHKKAKLLNVDGTQLEEADFEELLLTQNTEFEPGTQAVINAGNLVIAECSERLKNAKDVAGERLFTDEELEREYWTPLMRERVLPETFIADAYSLTQKMIAATNKLYTEESDKRTKEKKATAMKDGKTKVLNGSKKALGLAGSIASNFGDNGKIAAVALNGLGDLIGAGQSMAEKMEKAEWGDVASIGMTAIQGLTAALLPAVGVPKEIVSTVTSSIGAGSAVVQAATKFASGPDGVLEGVICLTTALSGALAAGASATSKDKDEKTKKTLEDLGAFLPGALTAAVRGGQMIKNVRDGDSEGAMKSLNEALSEGFKLARSAQLKEATKGMSDDDAEKYTKQFESDNKDLEASLNSVLEASPEAAARMAEKSRMAEHRAGIEELIEDVETALDSALAKGGLEAGLAGDLAAIYPTQVKAQAVLDILFKDDFNGVAAAKPLADALSATFAEVAKDAPALAGEAGKRAAALTSLATGLNGKMQSTLTELKKKKAAERSYEAVIATFTDGMRNGLNAALDLPGLTKAVSEANQGDFATKAQEKVAKQHVQIAQTEVNQELEELQAGIDGMTKAQQAGADASGIDELIAKLMRDRLIMKMALNVVAGGADMLSKVVPGLAVASSGVRMVGQLIAAAQRAQQLNRWINSRDDFEAAQSVLSSASRNFVKNQAEQLTDHSIDAALELARLIAAAAELSGPAAAGGTIAKGVIEGVSKFKEIIKEQYQEKELEDAWKLFKTSMAQPGNRRLALQVRAQHPTLAKYTIAWGAQVKGDLLARNALRACGLNEASLRNRDSDVNKVVQYLEVFYEEDQQLYRSLDKSLAWVPAPLELTSRCWVKIKLGAQTNKLWDAPATGTIDGLLVKLDEATKAVTLANGKLTIADGKEGGALEADVELVSQALLAQQSVLAKLATALDGVTPVGAKADPATLKEFKTTVLASLASKARTQGKSVDAALKSAAEQVDRIKKAKAGPTVDA